MLPVCLGTLLGSPGPHPREPAQPWERVRCPCSGTWPSGCSAGAEPRCPSSNSPRLSPASTLSQLSDSGQTLSEDSGVDIGEVEMSGKDKSRQPVPGKSRSLKEATRSEGVAEGAAKPVRLGAQGPRGAASGGRWALGAAEGQCCSPLLRLALCLGAATPLCASMGYLSPCLTS